MNISVAILYGGTEHTVSRTLGISLDEAKVLVDRYKRLYKGIYEYYDKQTALAKKRGYYLTPYGLKVRAPEVNAPDETRAQSAIRTAQNTLFQGTGAMTMIDSLNRFQQLIEKEKYDNDVILVITIHDSVYMFIKEDPKIIKWANENLIREMVKDLFPNQLISNDAELDIGYAWSHHETISKNATEEEIAETLARLKEKFE